MSNLVRVDSFEPLTIKSGDSICVALTYSTGFTGFIVVNESPEFDAVPGRIDVEPGVEVPKIVTLAITRQPASCAHECPITFTLMPASHTIMVHVT